MVFAEGGFDPTITKANVIHIRCLGYAGDCPKGVGFSENLVNGVWHGHSVTYENIQIAYHLGLNPVYLIGCDHNYAGEKNITEAVPVPSLRCNHFSDAYRDIGEFVNPAPIEKMTLAYEMAQSFAKKNNFNIFNATRGGYLDVFPRVDFDSIFA